MGRNVLLHETFKKDNSENTELTTWVFEGFVPTAKLVNGKAYSIISDHLGTPILAIDSDGMEVWNRQLDIYGQVKREIKASSLGDDVRPFIPFHYQGQYEDIETGLYYNRFRYYSPDSGTYISQDPIGLAGNNPNFYGYTFDCNNQIDLFGLDCSKPKGKKINRTVYRYSPLNRIATTWDTHIGNINATHRYTKSGVGGVYGANSAKTAMAEISHWGVDPDNVVLVSKKVSLKNVLDLTDPKVRDQLGVDLTDIVGDDYDVTHKLGDWAIENGYDGILAPSARNATGTNLIGFNGL